MRRLRIEPTNEAAFTFEGELVSTSYEIKEQEVTTSRTRMIRNDYKLFATRGNGFLIYNLITISTINPNSNQQLEPSRTERYARRFASLEALMEHGRTQRLDYVNRLLQRAGLVQ